MTTIAQNIDEVKENIRIACKKAGRNEDEITLIAVSKTKPLSMLKEAYECGLHLFGENKVQEICEKQPKMPEDAKFHMIGHLQTNKINQLIDKVSLIHSVDSYHLACEISKRAVAKNIICPILIEVNVANEESKFGVSLNEVEELVNQISALPGVFLKGLMTVAPYVENPEENRLVFRKLKQLCVDLKTKNIDNTSMDILSMGMTNDYMVAIEEGSNMIRVGTGIFGERYYNL